ncbi:ATP-binding protein [Phenylobacterium montanum]|uniref:histidine kinase n=1 Tax=Phenylobacterium montanum TaxID=2823693 RepID=A0A975FY81_9CAUL|nr:ATP-binding protein [Caulobacter sp. S6]QUD87620.1 response regulator [Caulobacter sp. S6]
MNDEPLKGRDLDVDCDTPDPRLSSADPAGGLADGPEAPYAEALALAHQRLAALEAALADERRERRRAEEALWQAQRHQAVGRLASGVAHHFSNLLTAIVGNLELVRREHTADASLTRKLDRASEAARRAVKLTRQLLTFSGRQLVRAELFDPSKGLVELIALLSGSLRGEIEVVTEVPAGLWSVRVDAGELELALLNLAINAGDAMGGAGRLKIAARNQTLRDDRLELDGDYLVIEVADSGPGIPPDILPRVFDPFFTTKAAGVGSGLGLSQVLGFAHQSKGAVDVAETPGGGATFRIYLPAARAIAADPPPARTQAEVVLVAEDDADLAEITASMLESLGFGVRVAYRAPAVLDMIGQGERIDLVLCGAALGGGTGGLELAREVRAAHPGLPVLLTCDNRAVSEAAEQEGLPALPRPYRAGDLYRRMTALMSGGA